MLLLGWMRLIVGCGIWRSIMSGGGLSLWLFRLWGVGRAGWSGVSLDLLFWRGLNGWTFR